ncbi:MAG: FMN-binding negative transcriptional regulator [Gammaproteobacteria bacterium]|nr:FMN-binding negative transcriptional regulator [Gammaproteobacteria bacterium]
MYTPPAFRQNDLSLLHQQINACPLATLVTQGANGLQASHLPLLLAADEGEFGTLYGHFARANPHWSELLQGETLAIFQGPQAYISPAWYPSKAEHGKAVPTWNYIAVHARGQAQLIEDREGLLQLVSRLSAQHEAGREQPWAVSEAPTDYIDTMLRAIVGFALPIQRLEGQWKLSQNRTAADRDGVHKGLSASPVAADQALAARLS